MLLKDDLIKKLQDIPGNLPIVLNTSGGSYKADDAETGLYEDQGKDEVYTFSIDRKKIVGIHDECIIIWG